MRSILLSLACVVSFSLIGQDWILVRPGWKYNYGTEDGVILNQIFTTDSDTLNADSIRYHLNTIATVCDTCTEIYQLGMPQFLQRSILVNNSRWHFHDPGSFVIMPEADPGETWVADTANAITAEVVELDSLTYFGIQDIHKNIQCSNGDTWVISKEWGIIQMNDNQLIGIHGPNVGSLIPTIHEMFPYQVGDVVEYHKAGHYGPYPFSSTGAVSKYTILDRTDNDSNIVFNTWRIRAGGTSLPTGSTPDYFPFADEMEYIWMTSSEELPYREILFQPPGTLIASEHQITSGSTHHECISRHGRDTLGRYVMECDVLIDGIPNGVLRYSEGIGLEEYTLSWWEHYTWLGSVIAGDTSGTVHADGYLLDVREDGIQDLQLYPNPACDKINITGLPAERFHFVLSDMTGRIVIEQTVHGPMAAMDVASLSPGIYSLIGPACYGKIKVMITR